MNKQTSHTLQSDTQSMISAQVASNPQELSPFLLTIKGITYQLTREQYQRLADKIKQFQRIEEEERLVQQQIERLDQEKRRLNTLLDDLATSDSDEDDSSDTSVL